MCLWSVHGQPILDEPHQRHGITLYRDALLPNVYYYAPGTLSLATRPDGQPEFRFTMSRYTGTALTRNQGKTQFNNMVQFKIVMNGIDTKALETVKNELSNEMNVQLQPLTIKNIQSTLAYTDINEEGLKGLTMVLGNGNFETAKEQTDNQNQTYWTERYYTLRLSNESAQLLMSTLEKGQTLLGFSYSFEADGISRKYAESRLKTQHVEVDAEKELQEKFKTDTVLTRWSNYVIYSDAFQIMLDVRQYKDLVHKIDLNAERIPADYAVLEVRCYDFNNALRQDLDAKRIEIEATGISRDVVVKQRFTFSALQSDIYVKTIQFPYVVRTDKPFRYRIVEISKTEIRPQVSEWREQKNWFALLDITSR